MFFYLFFLFTAAMPVTLGLSLLYKRGDVDASNN